MRKLMNIWVFFTFVLLLTKATSISDEQLKQFSEVLLRADTNIAQTTFNLQDRIIYGHPYDMNKPLFDSVPYDILKRPTYVKLMKLLDNYDRKVESPEDVTTEELYEMDDFLSAVVNTTVMRKVQEFLIVTGKISPGENFKNLMYDLWFTLYPRVRNIPGSSGFEHVFVGEIKDNSISGLHNWLQYYILEKQGQIKYQGFISFLPLAPPIYLLKYIFIWDPFTKPSNTMFIGTSPEFEMAIYTTCFMCRPNSVCPIRLGGKSINIYTFSYNYRGNTYIGSAYPGFSSS